MTNNSRANGPSWEIRATSAYPALSVNTFGVLLYLMSPTIVVVPLAFKNSYVPDYYLLARAMFRAGANTGADYLPLSSLAIPFLAVPVVFLLVDAALEGMDEAIEFAALIASASPWRSSRDHAVHDRLSLRRSASPC
jgi:ABC-type spermidine/putrescine transport system permease subunit II